jgi:mutator protein MutT
MRLIPVSLAIFYEIAETSLNVWVQTREDDGPFKGLLEFPGGGIESGETPLEAAVREVEEEVGITILAENGKFMGLYSNTLSDKTVLLYVHLFPKVAELEGKGKWLPIVEPELSRPYEGLIPPPNHKIIDELFLSLKN